MLYVEKWSNIPYLTYHFEKLSNTEKVSNTVAYVASVIIK